MSFNKKPYSPEYMQAQADQAAAFERGDYERRPMPPMYSYEPINFMGMDINRNGVLGSISDYMMDAYRNIDGGFNWLQDTFGLPAANANHYGHSAPVDTANEIYNGGYLRRGWDGFTDAVSGTADSFGRAYNDAVNVYKLRPFSGRDENGSR